MKSIHCAVVLLIAIAPACGSEPAAKAKPATVAKSKSAAAATAEPVVMGPPKSGDLRTRLDGDDWPSFLGPTGDSKSTEHGLTVPWPESGPKLVWQQTTGEGYGMPAISRGRLFLFSREGDNARLDCEISETGKPLWHFSYPSGYQDMYGYDLGPRCAPVVDG